MELLSDDIFRLIYCFLSTKDKINILMTNSNFKSYINLVSVLVLKMDYYMNKILSIDIRSRREMMLIDWNFYVPYQTLHFSTFNGISPLYCRNMMENTCIVERCREKRVGDIFIHIYCDYYTKRKMPYCLKCFKIWYCK